LVSNVRLDDLPLVLTWACERVLCFIKVAILPPSAAEFAADEAFLQQ
jgi:hypothetical protein